jgi:hypothetical protein
MRLNTQGLNILEQLWKTQEKACGMENRDGSVKLECKQVNKDSRAAQTKSKIGIIHLAMVVKTTPRYYTMQ